MVPWSAQARKERQEQNIGNDFNQSIESGKIHADCGKKGRPFLDRKVKGRKAREKKSKITSRGFYLWFIIVASPFSMSIFQLCCVHISRFESPIGVLKL